MTEEGSYLGGWDPGFEELGMHQVSRGKRWSREEMDREGVLRIINYETVVDDELADYERMEKIIQRGQMGSPGASVLVDMGLREHPKGGVTKAFSGLVFVNEFFMNRYLLRNRKYYPDLFSQSRLCN